MSALKRIRKAMGLTTNEVANLTGLKPGTISNIETKRRQQGWPSTRKRLSERLCLPEDMIFPKGGGDDNQR